ncbi:chromosome partitioning protein ParB [Microbacterium sorbitolivorans]|uniref:ParB/RepB/Spo0J family partition protein n=1 Tax=Microbacterium sorbitolivorans TaxID=1867410 RepID=A0A367Y4U7_9MICO|nr:ParB/RepB/Spo0J family partition protein [Microbacterium sorbitolivorans]RCK60041.1 ParB/RepB/Spo0J family partition protein [Microbacterium sorbitolivorans]GGF42213.1 chromosome partitioning protein ParB [Microbacterium sorbitolivorans]
MAKRTGLGRGIGALIPTGTESKERPADVFFSRTVSPLPVPASEEPVAKAEPVRKPAAKKPAARKPAAKKPAAEPDPQLAEVPGIHLIQVDPHKIVPNPRQPRTLFDADDLAELVHSVREFGVLQPVVVRDKKDGTYELIMGERRTRASREAGLEAIPAIVRDTADEDLLRDALLENIHRAQLNPLEEASAYQQLINDFGITQDQLADRIGRSRPQISNTIRLLRLPEGVQERVAAGVLTAGHARAILSLDGDSEAMAKLADKIVNEELSVRSTEAVAKRILETGAKPKKQAKPKQGARRAYLDEVSDKLGDRLDTKVKIDLTARQGSIKISFATIQDLNRILSELGESGYEQ